MVLIKTAPYGEWESPITAEDASAEAPVLTSPKICVSQSSAFSILHQHLCLSAQLLLMVPIYVTEH